MNKPQFAWRGLLLLALTQLTACGLKGPLYMPKDVPPAQQQTQLVEQTLGAGIEP